MSDLLKFVPEEIRKRFADQSEVACSRYEQETKKAISEFDEKRKIANDAYNATMDAARLELIAAWKAAFDDQEICGMPEVSVRTKNCLLNDSEDGRPMLSHVAIKYTEGELLRIPNFGRKSLLELREIMGVRGLYIGIFHRSNWRHE